MLTTEFAYILERYPVEGKSAILALSVLIDRLSGFPKADRDDLFELVQEWHKATEIEEQQSIRRAMEEILAQIPVKARTSVPVDRPLSERRKAWAEHVGKKIKELREKAGWTQVQLAKRIGLPQSHISRLENAEYTPTHLTLSKLAAGLGVAVGDIDPCVE